MHHYHTHQYCKSPGNQSVGSAFQSPAGAFPGFESRAAAFGRLGACPSRPRGTGTRSQSPTAAPTSQPRNVQATPSKGAVVGCFGIDTADIDPLDHVRRRSTSRRCSPPTPTPTRCETRPRPYVSLDNSRPSIRRSAHWSAGWAAGSTPVGATQGAAKPSRRPWPRDDCYGCVCAKGARPTAAGHNKSGFDSPRGFGAERRSVQAAWRHTNSRNPAGDSMILPRRYSDSDCVPPPSRHPSTIAKVSTGTGGTPENKSRTPAVHLVSWISQLHR